MDQKGDNMDTKVKTSLDEIRKILERHSGGLLKPAEGGNMKGEFDVMDNDELMFIISSLLKTCVFALEEDGSGSALFNFSRANRNSHVVVTLEFVIGLLPRNQIVAFDEIYEVVAKLDEDNTN